MVICGGWKSWDWRRERASERPVREAPMMAMVAGKGEGWLVVFVGAMMVGWMVRLRECD